MGKRVWQYPEATGITNDDVILLDSPTGGSRSIKANEIGSVLINKTLTERGTFDAADDNVDGYKKVTVDVPYTDVEVASGPVASWDDGEDLPLKSLTSFIEPQQEGSGDPSPTNIHPISGWDKCNVVRCGKNLADGYTIAQSIETNGGTLDTINKTISYSGSVARATGKLPIIFKNNTRYTIMARVTSESDATNINARVVYTDGTTQNLGAMTKGVTKVWTTNASKSVDYITFEWVTGTTTMYYEELGVFEGVLTAEDFEPYNGQTYTIDLGGTRYGGTLDVVSGVLTVTGVEIKMGTLNWTKCTDYGDGSWFLSQEISDKKIGSYNMMSSQYVVKQNRTYINATGQIAPANNTNSKDLVVRDDRYSDANTFKTAMNEVQLVYELATPQTIQLTPTQVKSLVGQNNIYSDTGDVDVEYQKLWVRPSA